VAVEVVEHQLLIMEALAGLVFLAIVLCYKQAVAVQMVVLVLAAQGLLDM
jgi:hypothetical protein